MMSDDDIARVVDRALAHVPAEHADQRPLAVPLEAQRGIVDRAIEDARAAGLRLPNRFVIRWVMGQGGCARLDNGAYRMALGVEVPPDDLRRTALHELQHLADYTAGVRLSRVELERRAIAFAEGLMGKRW